MRHLNKNRQVTITGRPKEIIYLNSLNKQEKSINQFQTFFKKQMVFHEKLRNVTNDGLSIVQCTVHSNPAVLFLLEDHDFF